MTDLAADTPPVPAAEASAGSPRWRPGLLVHYILILAALLVPMLAVLAIVGVELQDAYRKSVDRRLETTAQSLAVAIERSFLRHIGALEALADSPAFGQDDATRDLPLLYAHAKRTGQSLGTNIVVIRPDLSQLLNTLQPLGTNLPRTGGTKVALRTFETGTRQFSNLVYGRVAKRYAVGAIVPVRNAAGDVVMAIAAPFDPEIMSEVLAAGLGDFEGFSTLVDANNKVIARSNRHDDFVGKDVPGWWIEATAGQKRGMVVGPNLLGRDVLIYHLPVPGVPNWTLAVALPKSIYEDYWRQPLLVFFTGLLGALTLAAGLAFVLARRVQRPLTTITRTASEHARLVESGAPLRPVEWPAANPPVREIAELRNSLEFFEREVARRDTLQRETLAKLETALADRELLLGEVYHRVKNNLQQIAAMIALQSRNLDDEDAKTAMSSIAGRVRALGLIHEMLLKSAHPSRLDVREFLGQLCRHIVASHDLETRKVTIDVTAASEQIELDAAIPVGLLVTELVVNSVKHAFSGRDGGTIRVTYEAPAGGPARLSVADDGTGIREGATSGTPGSGSRIAEGLARQLGGTLEITTGSAGTTATVAFPAPGAKENDNG